MPEYPEYRRIDKAAERLKTISTPGFSGFPVHQIFSYIIRHFKELRFFERAAAIAFNFLLAIPPSLIFLLSLVPFLPLDNVQTVILQSIELIAPNEKMYQTAHSIIVDFMNTKRRELLSFGFLLTLFYSSNGMQGVIRSFDMVHKIYVPRTGWKRRGRAITLTMLLMIFIIIGIVLVFVQTNVMDRMLSHLVPNVRIVKYASFLLVLGLVYFSFCIIYTYAPSLQKRMRFFSVGAFLATISFMGVSYGFFFIVTQFVNYNLVYGPLGTMLMFMIWIYISACTILAGYEINAAIMLHTMVRNKELDDSVIA
jgi:membrane protein